MQRDTPNLHRINVDFVRLFHGRSMLISREDTVFVVVDVLERLVPPMADAAGVLSRLSLVGQAAGLLNVPTIVTEHCPDRIGRTHSALAAWLPTATLVVEKTHFAATAEDGLVSHLAQVGRSTIVLGGMEAHVCVLQTAIGLRALGHRVVLMSDGVTSRRASDKDAALCRLGAADIEIAPTEMVLFEWIAHAADPAFRLLLPGIKKGAPIETCEKPDVGKTAQSDSVERTNA